MLQTWGLHYRSLNHMHSIPWVPSAESRIDQHTFFLIPKAHTLGVGVGVGVGTVRSLGYLCLHAETSRQAFQNAP